MTTEQIIGNIANAYYRSFGDRTYNLMQHLVGSIIEEMYAYDNNATNNQLAIRFRGTICAYIANHPDINGVTPHVLEICRADSNGSKPDIDCNPAIIVAMMRWIYCVDFWERKHKNIDSDSKEMI